MPNNSTIVFVEYTPDWRDNFPNKQFIFKGSISESNAGNTISHSRKSVMDSVEKQVAEKGATVLVITTENIALARMQNPVYSLRGNAYLVQDAED